MPALVCYLEESDLEEKIGVVGIQFGSISIINNAGFSLLLGRICVNEDFYDLLAQVTTFHIV